MKSRNILILFVILALLLGIYVYIDKNPKKTTPDEASNTETKIELIKLEEKDINTLEISKEGSTLTLVKKGEVWLNKDYEKDEVNQEMVKSIISSFALVGGERVVDENPSDLSKYGLKDPKYRATITLNSGENKTLYIGDETAGNLSYAMVKGDVKVYGIYSSILENFSVSRNSLISINISGVDFTQISELTIDKFDGKPIVITKNENVSEEEAQFSLNIFNILTYKTPRGVDTGKLSTFLEALKTIVPKGIEEKDAKDLSKYGLDKGKLHVIAKDSKNTLDILIGKSKNDSEVYFKTMESNTVYISDSSSLSGLNITAFELADKLAYIVNIDNVDEITIDKNGKKDSFILTHTVKKAEKEGEKDTNEISVKYNGKDVEISAFKKFYQSLIGISLDGENNKDIKNNPEVKITYKLNKGATKEVQVDFTPYNNDFYAVFKNGSSEFLSAKDKMANMYKEMEKLK